MKYVVFNNAGEILRSGECPASMLSAQANPGEAVVEGVGDDTNNYADPTTNTIFSRPNMAVVASSISIAADLTDYTHISGIPAGARLEVSGPVQYETTVDDGNFDMCFSTPGDYVLRFELFPYKPAEVAVNAY